MKDIQITKEEIQELGSEFAELTDKEAYDALKKRLRSRRWRLDNLYKIKDESGKVLKFKMNYAQKLLFLGFWFCNIILKSRQHGITTFICILYLDTCLFNSNISAGIIAHNNYDAKFFFKEKIKFAYDELPAWLRGAVPAREDSKGVLSFNNGSSLRVTTSGRSGSFQLIHVSELGKMAAKYPSRADEVITGTLNAIHVGQLVTIESTAEGKEGVFFDMCQIAEKAQQMGVELGKMDYKFFFFGANENELNHSDDPVPIPKRLEEKFNEIEAELNIRLPMTFKWWYVSKESVQGEFMKREHPLTPKEAFESSMEGAYYATQMAIVRKRKQIAKVPYQENILVNTAWDLGIGESDFTVIWFFQVVGREIHLIDYYENSGEGLQHYVDYLRNDLPYRYGRFFAPHDIHNREWTAGKTRVDIAAKMGIPFRITDRISLASQIQFVRNILPICWFDEEKCERGIATLDGYRKEWNDKLGIWRDHPRHDWASHGASAFAVLAQNINWAHGIDDGPMVDSGVHAQLDQDRGDPGGWT